MVKVSESQHSANAASAFEHHGSEKNYDVAVIGAGPQGLLYASWLKLARPQTKVIVLEREKTPKHKIGESTLSGFCKALRSVGIRQEVLQRLFFKKMDLVFSMLMNQRAISPKRQSTF